MSFTNPYTVASLNAQTYDLLGELERTFASQIKRNRTLLSDINKLELKLCAFW